MVKAELSLIQATLKEGDAVLKIHSPYKKRLLFNLNGHVCEIGDTTFLKIIHFLKERSKEFKSNKTSISIHINNMTISSAGKYLVLKIQKDFFAIKYSQLIKILFKVLYNIDYKPFFEKGKHVGIQIGKELQRSDHDKLVSHERIKL